MATGEAAVGAGEHPEDARVLIHDLRNLLAVVVNYCELIAAETTDPEAVSADILEIRTAAERALVLTDRLPRPPKRDAPSEPAAGGS